MFKGGASRLGMHPGGTSGGGGASMGLNLAECIWGCIHLMDALPRMHAPPYQDGWTPPPLPGDGRTTGDRYASYWNTYLLTCWLKRLFNRLCTAYDNVFLVGSSIIQMCPQVPRKPRKFFARAPPPQYMKRIPSNFLKISLFLLSLKFPETRKKQTVDICVSKHFYFQNLNLNKHTK